MIKRNCTNAFLLLLLGTSPTFASALSGGSAPIGVPTAGRIKFFGFYGTFENAVGWIFVVAIVLGVLMFITSGILYMTAGGDQAKRVRASKMAMVGMTGIAIAALAWTLVNIAGNFPFSIVSGARNKVHALYL